jgi:hypothetical protein
MIQMLTFHTLHLGALSKEIHNLQLLEGLMLGDNHFSGNIPVALASPNQGTSPCIS